MTPKEVLTWKSEQLAALMGKEVFSLAEFLERSNIDRAHVWRLLTKLCADGRLEALPGCHFRIKYNEPAGMVEAGTVEPEDELEEGETVPKRFRPLGPENWKPLAEALGWPTKVFRPTGGVVLTMWERG